ncbi:MAG: YcxB family protein [Clostridia bacterium]|nr:YcxB family protein [Clostridia bacterium]
MNIKASGKTDQKTVKAMFHAGMGKLSLIGFLLSGLMIGFFIYESVRGGSGPYSAFWLVIALPLLALTVFVHFFIPKLAYDRLGNYRDCRYDYEFRDELFTIRSSLEGEDAVGSRSYDSVARVIETSEYFFIYQTANNALAVDKSTIEGGTAEDIRAKLAPGLGKSYVLRK